MRCTQMLIGVAVVIAVTVICGTEGIPGPQKLLNDFTEVDGFVFDGPVDKTRQTTTSRYRITTVPIFSTTKAPRTSTRTPITTSRYRTTTVPIFSTTKAPRTSTRTPITTSRYRITTVPIFSTTKAPRTSTRTPITTAPTGSPLTRNVGVDQCVQNCRFQVTSEYNPVCGTDGTVYDNLGILRCAKRCGRNVDQDYFGPCISRLRG